MVGVSYHELTAGTKKDERYSAGQRKQFLVLCVIGVAVCANAFINAGLLEPVVIRDDGIYPGGEFVHKVLEERDFATTGGIWRRISKDLQPKIEGAPELDFEDDSAMIKFDDSLYAVYVDDFTNGFGRYFSGILIDGSQSELKNRLLETNVNTDIHEKNRDDKSAENRFLRLKYEVGDLPSVRAAVATFPFTDGFVSALLHNYKVFPALSEYAKKDLGLKSNIVVSTTCNRELKLCNHYVPMIENDKFFLNQPKTEEYLKTLGEKNKDKKKFDVMVKGLKRMFGF